MSECFRAVECHRIDLGELGEHLSRITEELIRLRRGKYGFPGSGNSMCGLRGTKGPRLSVQK